MSDLLSLTVLPPESPPPRATDVDADGWVYDVETGEVLGHTDVAEDAGVATLEEAERLLELRSRVEGRIAGLQARREALVKNLTAQIAAETRRLSWWDCYHRPRLVEYARAHLPKKGKTWRCAWGKVAFRKSAGTTEILDMAEAVAFVEGLEPSLVKVVKSVGVKAVAEAQRIATELFGEPPALPFVRSTGETEAVSVETGVDVEPGGHQ